MTQKGEYCGGKGSQKCSLGWGEKRTVFVEKKMSGYSVYGRGSGFTETVSNVHIIVFGG